MTLRSPGRDFVVDLEVSDLLDDGVEESFAEVFNGVLQPDHYDLSIVAETIVHGRWEFSAQTTASWDMTFLVVPEPSMTSLLGVGLAVLGSTRRHRLAPS